MELQWTGKARSDLMRLYDFLAPVNPRAATQTIKSLVAAPMRLLENPRLGDRLSEYEPREVRRILVGRYEMRYEIRDAVLYVLRIWHTREDR